MKKVFKDKHEQFCYALGYQEAQKEFLEVLKNHCNLIYHENGIDIEEHIKALYNGVSEELKKVKKEI